MQSKEEAKQEVRKLIEFYNSNKDSFKESSEADIRIKLIDRLFEILGWDVWGRKIGSEVTREETVKMKESKKKKADYAFRLHGIPKFVVEAKAIKNIDLSSDEFREQAVGYAYNLACSWAVLTNFVKTRIYFVDKEDGVVTFNINDVSDLDSFDKHFEILWFLSNEAVKDDLLGKYLDDKGIKPQKGSVGKQLYEDLKEWRSILSDEIKSKHGNYEKYVIEEIVQRIIDRLIFIRKVEDMEIEERKLEQLTRRFNEGKTYEQLKIIFKTYRQKYNSGLFGEKEEHECDRISISDKPIETMIRGMYVPKGRRIEYNFAVIDADVLGNIYEQYLAYILLETPKKAKLEGGRSHRKEQGIYYTPIYIVDYIVKNTVSEALKDKTIDEMLSAKILDPACGSGSFLIKAFSEVCKMVENKMKKGDRSKISPSLKDYSGRLTMKQKITILLSCIYGVDLDKKAVEIAQLNLLFKLLEGETAETISQIEGLRKILPTLGANIKHGNSLIDDKKIAGDDTFKWEEQFSDIMKNGGFDIVIGNPPYFNLQTIDDEDTNIFFEKKYVSYRGKADVLYLFIERANALLNEKGLLGFIVANYFLKSHYADKLRNFILDNYQISKIIDFGSNKIFQDANVDTCILIFTKSTNKNNMFLYGLLQNQEGINDFLTDALKNKSADKVNYRLFFDTQLNKNNNPWQFGSVKISDTVQLSEICNIGKGAATGNDDIFIVDKKVAQELKFEPGIIDLIVDDSSIDKYTFKLSEKVLIRTKRGIIISDYPRIEKYLQKHKVDLQKRYAVQKEGLKWFEIVRYNDDLFSPDIKEQIYAYYRSTHNKFAYSNKRFITLTTTFVLTSKNKYEVPLKYLLGLLNSKFIENYSIKNAKKMGSCFEYSSNFIGAIPIKIVPQLQQKPLISLVDKMLSLNKKLSEMKAKTDARAKLEEEIKRTDAEIDVLVYKIYGITEEEKKVIEESLK